MTRRRKPKNERAQVWDMLIERLGVRFARQRSSGQMAAADRTAKRLQRAGVKLLTAKGYKLP